jgi:DNA-binding protein H-NS
MTTENAAAQLSYRELLAQREKLEKEIAAARDSSRAEILEQIRGLVSDYELHDCVKIIAVNGKASRPSVKAAPKYRNVETGDTWSGRGKPPLWIAGKDRETFLIKTDA